MAASGDGAAAGPSYGIVLWIEWPAGKWNALLQASKSPFKGDIKIDPFRARAQEGEVSGAHTACRILSEETFRLFHLDPSLLPSAPLPGGDIFHLRASFPPDSPLLQQLTTLLHENAVALQQTTASKGLALIHVPLSAPKSSQPTKIRVTPQAIKLFENLAKNKDVELPEIELSHEKKADTNENVITGKSSGKAGKLVETGPAYKVADEEDQWRYPAELLAEAIAASPASSSSGAGAKKSVKAAIQKRKEAAAQQTGARAAGRGAGPSAQSGGRHKPTSKPKATSC